MKSLLTTAYSLLTCLLLSSLVFVSCKSESDVPEVFNYNDGGEEEQDGIAFAQQMEFLQTKDPALGYIPKDRLLEAVMEYRMAKQNGTYLTESTEATGWTERGPNTDIVGPSNGNGRVAAGQATSGRMRAVWIDLDNPNRVWVGGVDGGVWNTSDITATSPTWIVANDQLGNLAVADIVQDPINHDIMYYSTGERSINGDAVIGGGIFKSTDHGVTWSLLPGTTSFWNCSRLTMDAAGNLYVSVVGSLFGIPGSTGGIYRSTDDGATWSANLSPTGLSNRVTEMVISSTGRMHITCGYYNTSAASAGYRYTDNPATVTSATWTSPIVSFSPVQYNCDIAVAGNTLYALPASASFQTSQVWKSIDGGANWAITATTPTTGGATPVSSGQAWYNLAIGVDPSNADNVMVGGLNSYRSTNGGLTWTANSVWVTGVPGSGNYIHADHHIIVWNGNMVLDGGDGGIFYSADDGATWDDRNDGLRLKQFYACAIHPTSTNYFLAGSQDNGVHQLNAAGLTSSVEVTGGDGAFVHIDEDQPSFQWGSYVFNNYRRSTNSGASWSAVTTNDNGSFINPTDYDDMNNIMYCGSNANLFYRWSNAQTGGTLTLVGTATLAGGYVSHVKVSPYTPNRVYFGGGNDPGIGTGGGKIVRADNANATPIFTDITGSGMTANTNVSCVAVGTTDNNLIATFSNYGVAHVWFSSTGGGAAAWTNITGNLPDIPVRWAMFNPEDNDQAIIATEMGIYETTDINAGATVWVKNSTFPTVKTNMLQYRFSDNTILAATHGRGLWTGPFVPTNAYVRFASSYNYSPVRTEATGASTGCRNYTDYTLNMHIDRAPVGTANVTLSIAGGATATQGIDYDFTTNGNFAAPSSVVTFPNGGTADQPVTIRVYNDAEVEALPIESFTFNYSIGGGTDAIAAPSSSSYTFYIAENDAAPVSGTNAIATVLSTTRTEHLGNNGTYYFYSGTNIINSISGASLNLGCVTSSIFEAGNVWQSFLSGQRSQKVFDIVPTTNPGATYTVGLYFTALELTGETPATLRIAKTTAATMATANSSNTVLMVTPPPVAYGTGWIYTVTFTGFSKFFLVDAGAVLPVSLLSFNGQLENGRIPLKWSTSSEQDSKNFELEKSSDGSSFYSIAMVSAAGNSNSLRNYGFVDKQVNEFNYYRLKMVDLDARYIYSQVILIKNPNASQDVNVVNNPFGSFIDVRFTKIPKQAIRMELVNMSGSLMYRKEYGPMDRVRFDLSGVNISRGSYILRTTVDGKQFGNKLVKQ